MCQGSLHERVRQNGLAIALRELGRASGLYLLAAAIVLWNTVYLERATNNLRDRNHSFDDALLRHLSPLGWEHINLTGDYT